MTEFICWSSTSRSSMASLRWFGRRRWSSRRSEMPHARSWCVFFAVGVCAISLIDILSTMQLTHRHAHKHICDAKWMQERSKAVLQAMTDESGKLQHKLDCANKELDWLTISCQNVQQVLLMHDYMNLPTVCMNSLARVCLRS